MRKLWPIIMVICGIVSCTNVPVATVPGSGSDTPNSLTGSLVYPGGGFAANAVVRMRPADYCADTATAPLAKTAFRIANINTDSTGHFSIDKIDTGNYVLEVTDSKFRGVLIRCHIDTGATTISDTLLPTGTMQGVWDPFSTDTLGGYVQVVGCDRVVRVEKRFKTFSIDNIPTGKYALRFLLSHADPQFDSVTIVSGQIIHRLFSPWKFVKKITLNTTLSGANVPNNVTNFPVLVRLTNENFNFNEAKPDGSDLRFTKSDYTQLPFEIESWEPADGHAEIWVKVDTVLGNNNSQNLSMLWGAAAGSLSAIASNGNAVFDSANGWVGVYHLGEDVLGVGTNGAYKNAVHDKNNGDDSVMSSNKSGIIGKGQYFGGADKIVVSGAAQSFRLQAFTVSAWVKAYSPANTKYYPYDIASMGDNYILRIQSTVGSPKIILYKIVNGSSSAESSDTLTNAIDSTWHHMVGTCNGQSINLYFDGVLLKSNSYSGQLIYNGGSNFVIGSHGNNLTDYGFVGSIDEVECSSVARSADWVKLQYESQKTGTTFISIK